MLAALKIIKMQQHSNFFMTPLDNTVYDFFALASLLTWPLANCFYPQVWTCPHGVVDDAIGLP